MIILKSPAEIEIMAAAGSIVASAIQKLKEAIKPGLTTRELNRIAEDLITKKGAIPAFKGYRGFPASICTSINQQVVHGIPGPYTLKDGDIVSIDIGTVYNGYYGDAAFTCGVGEVTAQARRLMEVTEQSLYEGINRMFEGNRLSDISYAVQSYVEKNGFSVVRDYVGHGIGQNMHEDPQVPNFGLPGKGPRLKEGMVLAVEPMVNVGSYHVKTLEDNWTVVTADSSLSAHFEHTVAITGNGPQILTQT
jgi:methionyl aminopeptidase